MNVMTPAAGLGRRALVLSALAGALFAALLVVKTDSAQAAYSARIDGDTLRVVGNADSDVLALRLRSGSPNILELDVGNDGTADFSFDRTTFSAIDVQARGGEDEVRIDQSGGAFTDEQVTIDGGAGDDTLVGGSGAETFVGGSGADFVDGKQGTDVAVLGGGADRFQWDPGDNSDVVEGQDGKDVLDFNGSNIAENIDVSANGPRVRFTRNIASIVMDLAGIDTINFRALGGADNVVVNDLAGTDTSLVNVNLDATGGGGDGAADNVTANGTAGPDQMKIGSGPAGEILVSGLSAQLQVSGGEEANDNVNVATLGGADTIAMGVGSTAGPVPVNFDGGDDQDLARYTGTPGDDSIQVVANGTEASIVSAGTTRFDSIAESLVVLGSDGADTITGAGNLAPLTALTIEGGPGEDMLRGGNGADVLNGGGGDDLVDGNQGADTAFLGKGADTFQWDPGDGSDVVEGQGGQDALEFNGSNISENIEVSPNGPRVRFTRNIANIVMDLAGIERVNFRALGGADNVAVDDLAGTDVGLVDVDLNAGGGGGGDGAIDAVTAFGTADADHVTLESPGGFPTVNGFAAQVLVEGAEPANDTVNVSTLGGDDTVTTGREVFGPESYNVDGGEGHDVARYNGTSLDDSIDVVANGTEASTVSPLASRLDVTAVEELNIFGLGGTDTITGTGNLAPLTTITMNGGDDGDVLRGGNGADVLIGGPGDDFVDGNQGADTALLGAGDDTFQWDPGDGSDVVEGQAGADTLAFNGSNIAENIEISANGGRLRFTRNIASIVMDLNSIEHVAFRALGGADNVVVGDLTGTDVDNVDVDLAANGGGGDGAADLVTVNGTNRRDVVNVTRSGSQVLTSGLRATTGIVGSEPTLDTLLVQTLDGDDDVTVAPDVADLIVPVVE